MALALGFVLLIAWAQARGWLVPLNHGVMQMGGVARTTAEGAPLTAMMIGISAIGGTLGRIALLAVATGWLLLCRRRRDAGWLLATVAGGTALNLLLKQLFAAPRPDLLPHLDLVHSYSFPSGHAAGSMILFGAMAMLAMRWWAWAAAALTITLVGISRVWLGVHWPSDVLAGWVEGIGFLAFCGAWLHRSRRSFS